MSRLQAHRDGDCFPPCRYCDAEDEHLARLRQDDPTEDDE